MGYVLRLRTMTHKSVFDGGKFKDCSVDQLIALKESQYLRYQYYNRDRISFIDTVLKDIGITEDWMKIEKPGKNTEMMKKVNSFIWDNLTEDEYMHQCGHKKAIENHKRRHIYLNRERQFTSKRMQLKNQGH